MFGVMENAYMDEPRSEIDWRVVQTMQLGHVRLRSSS